MQTTNGPSNVITFLPPLTFNEHFIRAFAAEDAPCAVLCVVETAGKEKGFIALNTEKEWKPISHLPVFAWSVDGWVETLQEQYQTILPAKDRPHAMDDYTVGRIFEVIGKQKDDLWMWQQQLSRWEKLDLDRKQQNELKRLNGQIALIKKLIESILALAEELKDQTIEKVMAKDDAEVALEFLMGKWKP